MASDPPPPYYSYSPNTPPLTLEYAPSAHYIRPPLTSPRSSGLSYRPRPTPNQHSQPHSPPPISTHPRVHIPTRTGSGFGYPSPISRSGPGAGAAGLNGPGQDNPARAARRRIATETLAAMAEGIYSARGTSFNLRRRVKEMVEGVRYYAPNGKIRVPPDAKRETHIEVVNSTTLDAARKLEKMYLDAAQATRGSARTSVTLSPGTSDKEGKWVWGIDKEKFNNNKTDATTQGKTGKNVKDLHLPRIGILSSASPFAPAGNFLVGDDGQELSIARASTLSAALKTRTALPFYHTPVAPLGGAGNRKASTKIAYHTHALVYAPGVSVIRDERGLWTPPMAVDVITCTAVHAGDARALASPSSPSSLNMSPFSRPSMAAIEAQIERTMTERLSRVLTVFASHAVHTLVLPAFGAGTFQNDIASVARIYATLLVGSKAPFAGIFDKVVFAITPENKSREFETAFWGAVPRRREHIVGASGTQGEGQMHTPRQRVLRTLREDGIHNSDARSIVSTQDGRATTALSNQRRAPRQLDDGASVRNWRLSLADLSLADSQDSEGRATVISRRNSRFANDALREADDRRSSVDESQDGALEYL